MSRLYNGADASITAAGDGWMVIVVGGRVDPRPSSSDAGGEDDEEDEEDEYWDIC